jgi:integrase
MRRLALDDTTVDILSEHRRRYDDLARELQVPAREDAFLFSHKPDRDVPYDPDAVSHRYIDMCAQLGINCHLHALRHYSATELLSSGVDLRTVAGRLGHGGGGTTTLRVYAAWVSESDKKAATILAGKIARPRRT